MHSKIVTLSAAALTTFVFSAQASIADEYSQGASLYSAGNYAGAKAHLIKATVAKPKSWQAQYQLANTYVQLKDSANAKVSYQKCIKNNPPADVKANCTNALTYIAGNPKLVAPAAPIAAEPQRPVQMIAPKGSLDAKPPADPSLAAAGISPELAARREKVIKEGEDEVNKVKAQIEERRAEMEASSNNRTYLPDGNTKMVLSEEDKTMLQKDLDAKSATIRDRYKKKAEALH